MAHRLALLISIALSSCASTREPAMPQAASFETIRGHRAALIAFWAPWCEACLVEIPALNRLHDETPRERAVIVGVAVGEADDLPGFVRRHQVRYAQLIDQDFKLADTLGRRRVPTTVVLDASGKVRYVGGALDDQAILAFREVTR
jgi:thiol-disulfide isomerase/thioredoxin